MTPERRQEAERLLCRAVDTLGKALIAWALARAALAIVAGGAP
jgi:hypothetical protein